MAPTRWLKGCLFLVVSFGADGVRQQSMRASKSNNSTQRGTSVEKATLTETYPFYHTTDSIHSELKDLATRCPGMSFRTESRGSLLSSGSTDIDVVTIKSKSSKPVNRMFVLFGEHARELISPETGLYFIKSLCGETDLSSRATDALQDTEFQIIVNGNPRSRAKVEHGDYCLRVNPSGVDLNRNWAEGWDSKPSDVNPVDTNPGPAPFSEPETQIFKKLVTDFDPTVFLTIHSGTRGLYMPWAYNPNELGDQNQKQMLQLLIELDGKYCKCPYGGAGKEVGYACPGTCLDWIYDELKTPYAFAFEIYAHPMNDKALRARWEEKIKEDGAFIQQHNLAHSRFHDVFTQHPSDFVQLRNNEHHLANHAQPQDCFLIFNPTDKEDYDKELNNWVNSYIDMAVETAAQLKAGKADMGTSSNATAKTVPAASQSATVLFKAKGGSTKLSSNATIPHSISFPVTGLE